MKKADHVTEETNIGIYQQFGISEWREKCLILSEEEQLEILKTLKSGDTSLLVEKVRLPFPKFVQIYYENYPGAKKYLIDPQFPYKLYLMSDNAIIYMNALIKNPKVKFEEIDMYDRVISVAKKEALSILEMPYEQILKLQPIRDRHRELQKKYIYISQYIDASQAEKLKLTSFTFKIEEGNYRSFDLNGKLALFNPAARIILSEYLGLHGRFRKSISTISGNLQIENKKITEFLDIVFDYLIPPTGMLKNKIGYVEREYRRGEFREYRNQSFSKIATYLEIKYIQHNKLDENEKAILKGYGHSLIVKYITQKYLSNNIIGSENQKEGTSIS